MGHSKTNVRAATADASDARQAAYAATRDRYYSAKESRDAPSYASSEADDDFLDAVEEQKKR
jgi:hypothetical protein